MRPEYQSSAVIWVVDGKNTDDGDTGMPDLDSQYVIAATTMATGVGVPNVLLYQVSVICCELEHVCKN